jgi:hypothetical protein
LKSLVKNIFTTIVALALLIGSTGFQLYKHSCAVHNISEVSLVETPECEQDHQVLDEKDDCCKVEDEEVSEPSCCKTEPIEESNQIVISAQEISCCFSSVESKVINDNLFHLANQKIIAAEFIVSSFIDIEKSIPQIEQRIILQNNNLPPPVFGKSLLTTLHQLKLDTPFC